MLRRLIPLVAAVAVLTLLGARSTAAQPAPAVPSEAVLEALRLQTEGLVAASEGRYDDALRLLDEALQRFRQLGDRRNEGRTLDSVGTVYRALYQFDGAIAIGTEALNIAREVGDQAGEANALVGLAAGESSLGRYPAALAHLQSAFTIAESLVNQAVAAGDIGALQLDALRALVILNNLGYVTSTLGRYADALTYYNEALDIARQLGERESEAATLNNIGDLYNEVGQYARAREFYEAALSLARADGDRESEVIYLNNVGSVAANVGEYEAALNIFGQALDLARALGDRSSERVALNNTASALTYLGRYGEARTTYEQSLLQARALGNRLGEGTVLNNLGQLLLLEGSHAEALPLLAEARAVARETGSLTSEATILSNTGYAHEQLNDLETALAAYLEAIALSEDVRAAARLEDLKTSLSEGTAGLYRRAALVQERLGRPREAFDLTERSRARSFLDQLGNVRVDPARAAQPELLSRERELRAEISALDTDLRREQAIAAAGQRGSTRAAELSSALTARQQAYSDVLNRLALADPETASLVSVAPLSLADVQALLDGETTLLSYFLTEDTTLAYVVTRSGFESVDLRVPGRSVREAVEDFRRFDAANLQAEYPAVLARLSAWLLDPVRDRLRTPRVGVIPASTLHYLPFAALRDGDAYFGETHTLFYLPSASTLPYIQAKQKPAAGGMLALAQSQAEGLPSLRYANGEAEQVAELYGATALTGSAATETAVRSAAVGAGIIHVAAHGELNPDAPLFSRIFLAPEGDADGSLTVHEVYGLTLDRADLVVLSACETVLGARNEGDDIIGLNRAFIYAGAPTVVASLWNVNDLATSVFMTAFYRGLQGGMTKGEAMQAAQAETRAVFPHPFHWAAFVLTGDAGPSTAR